MKSKLASEQVSKRERDLERKNGQGETERENPLSLRVGFWGRFWEGNTGGVERDRVFSGFHFGVQHVLFTVFLICLYIGFPALSSSATEAVRRLSALSSQR